MKTKMPTLHHKADFCVIGGGLAGMCAAIAAAREGVKTILMHDRPVLGGNASSEIRMWVCGADGGNNRETGILEEIHLENLYRNPYKLYPIWDSILYEKVMAEKNITLLLNCSCLDAEMETNAIQAVTGWQTTTQQFHRVAAQYFADCSGDSILAPLTNAAFRMGREAANEFDEQISTTEPDKKTMGMSCLIQARKGTQPVRYKAPEWAKKLTAQDMKYRRPNLEASSENFWYLELGGDRNTIDDTETIRDELLALAFGLWDYIKNSGEFDAALWQLDFVGFLPGKRESRRMTGRYIMTQNDVTSGGRFEDIVAYGGWPLDDHDPAGFYYDGHPCVQIKTPSPYGIPYRALYSANVGNLFFAGRNISMTHAAMSSARVMATCAMLGQAVGTAVSLAQQYHASPDEVYEKHIRALQQRLMYNDCFLPYNKREVSERTRSAALLCTDGGCIENLRDGNDRENPFLCRAGSRISYRFECEPVFIAEIRLIFDSDLSRTTLPGDSCERYHSMRANQKPDSPVMHMPDTLIKAFTLTAVWEDGSAAVLYSTHENRRRFLTIPVNRIVREITLTPHSNWSGSNEMRLFAFDIR